MLTHPTLDKLHRLRLPEKYIWRLAVCVACLADFPNHLLTLSKICRARCAHSATKSPRHCLYGKGAVIDKLTDLPRVKSPSHTD